jgi:hypothetical protein
MLSFIFDHWQAIIGFLGLAGGAVAFLFRARREQRAEDREDGIALHRDFTLLRDSYVQEFERLQQVVAQLRADLEENDRLLKRSTRTNEELRREVMLLRLEVQKLKEPPAETIQRSPRSFDVWDTDS